MMEHKRGGKKISEKREPKTRNVKQEQNHLSLCSEEQTEHKKVIGLDTEQTIEANKPGLCCTAKGKALPKVKCTSSKYAAEVLMQQQTTKLPKHGRTDEQSGRLRARGRPSK
jgi:hypothetical protein